MKKTAIELIAEERQRQIDIEGWTPDHDATHTNGELARAAACYCMTELVEKNYKPQFTFAAIMTVWPFSKEWFKPTPDNRIRELVKAGALIAAEIDRIKNK